MDEKKGWCREVVVVRGMMNARYVSFQFQITLNFVIFVSLKHICRQKKYILQAICGNGCNFEQENGDKRFTKIKIKKTSTQIKKRKEKQLILK